MNRLFVNFVPAGALALGVAAMFPSGSHAAIIINEVDYDNIGTDSAEFIELFNNGALPVDISGYVVVLYNGAAGASANTAYTPISTIPAATSLGAGAYYVIGSTNVTPRNQAFPGTTDQVQNGSPDALGLYSGGTFAAGSPSTTNNNLLLDGLIYEGTADPTNYPGFAALGTASADSTTLNYSVGRDGTGSFALLSSPTPGATNAAVVPEPSTTVALLSGLGMLGLLRRRNR